MENTIAVQNTEGLSLGRLLRALDLLALLGIIQGLWGLDVAVFAPQLLFSWVHWGTYLGLMYLQIGAAGVWLYWRSRG